MKRPDRFDSLAALQTAHAALVRDVGRDILGGENPDRIAAFVRSAVATGAVLDAKDDRSAAQSLIGYWTSRLVTAARTDRDPAASTTTAPRSLPEFDDTLLAEYDPATVGDTVATADEALAAMTGDERRLARMILLRLVRLRSDQPDDGPVYTVRFDPNSVDRLRAVEQAFDPVTALRDDFLRFGERRVTDPILDRLAAAGVIRIVPGEHPTADRVSLASAGLMTEWPALRAWMNERRAFADRAAQWVLRDIQSHHASRAPGVVTATLLTVGGVVDTAWSSVRRVFPSRVRQWAAAGDLLAGAELDDARKFHDRSPLERTFLARAGIGKSSALTATAC